MKNEANQYQNDIENEVKLDRRDLFDFTRSAIQSALEAGNAHEGMTASWLMQDATQRTFDLLGKILKPVPPTPSLDEKMATLRHAIEGGVKADSAAALGLCELVDDIGAQFKRELADAWGSAAEACDGVAAQSRNSLFRSGAKVCAGEIRDAAQAALTDERKAFEDTCNANGMPFLSRSTEPGFTHKYESPVTQARWVGWQLRAALAKGETFQGQG